MMKLILQCDSCAYRCGPETWDRDRTSSLSVCLSLSLMCHASHHMFVYQLRVTPSPWADECGSASRSGPNHAVPPESWKLLIPHLSVCVVNLRNTNHRYSDQRTRRIFTLPPICNGTSLHEPPGQLLRYVPGMKALLQATHLEENSLQ